MRILEQIFLIVFQTSLTTGILILIVFAILKIFSNKLSIMVKYLLMSLILIRLIVPVTTQTNIKLNIIEVLKIVQLDKEKSLVNEYSSDSKLNNSESKVNSEDDTLANRELLNKKNNQIQNQKKYILRNIVDVGAILWCVGIVVLMCILTLIFINFKVKFNNLKGIKDENIIKILNRLKQHINLKSNITLCTCDEKKSPFILGIIKPQIYLPQYILELNEKMISHILLHELMHYKRKDLYFNLICWIMLLLHWFNPLVWIAVKKLKTYREYACDSCVLQIFGEEKNLDYGMTIVNLSKIVTNKRGIQFGLSFERNNVIKERIEMIRDFKNDSFKISAKGALACLAMSIVICTNGITVNALDINNSSGQNTYNQISTENENKFLIDSTVKSYDNLSKVKKVAGFEFKLPDKSLGNGKLDSIYQVIKISDHSNAIYSNFRDSDSNRSITLEIFKDDSVDALTKIYKSHSQTRKNDSNIEWSKENINVGSIQGECITLKINNPERTIGDYTIPQSINEVKYFVWQNADVFYAIPYESKYNSNEQVKESTEFEYEDLDKIVNSLNNIDEIKNVDYFSLPNHELSTEARVMNIYDKDDLSEVEKMLEFNPNFPLLINGSNLQQSSLGVTSDSDLKNNDVNYELNNFYEDDKNMITFNQSKHNTFNRYSSAKDKGYIYMNEANINTEKVNIDGCEIYRCMEEYVDERDTKETIEVDYFWKKDGVYYSINIFNTDGYHDEIVKEFINSNPID